MPKPSKPSKGSGRVPPFLLDEYETAFQAFLGEAIQEVAFAREPLLADISVEDTTGSVGSIIQDQHGEDVELVSPPIGTEVQMSRNAAIKGDTEPLLLLVDKVSQQLAEGLTQNLIQTLDKVTEATGNVTDASGKPTFDALMESLEQVEHSLNEEDELEMPTLLMNPADVEKLPKPTPEQEARMEAFKEAKLKELLARRRSRRLS